MQYIFCCGMYRSSSTWQYEVVSHLVEKYRQGVRLGFVHGKRSKDLPGREHGLHVVRILKTHDVQEIFKRELNAGNALPIYSYRDLRDVAFSYMHKAALTFEELIKQKFLEKVLANDSFWRAAPHVVCQKYEDVIADEVAAVIRLSRAVGVELPPEQAVQLAQEYSWEANLKRSREVADRAKATGIDLTKKANVFTQDSQTLLHWNHLRQGDRKSWRELATPDQRKVLSAKCSSWLIANGYEADDSWAATPLESDARKNHSRPSAVARLDGRSLGVRPTAWFRSLWQGMASRLSLRR